MVNIGDSIRKFLFVSAFTVSLAVITPAMAQPWPNGIGPGPPPATAYPPTAAPTTPRYGGNTAPVTNGEISGRIPTGATMPGENNGSMKIGAIITGEHSAQRKIGSSAGILKNKEHQIMRRKQDTLVV